MNNKLNNKLNDDLNDKLNLKNDSDVDQVEIDLLRTLPNNCHYATLESDGISRLRNVLLAFAVHKPDVGYCQVIVTLIRISLL